MKPLEAADYLRQVRDAISSGGTVPPYVRTWFCSAVEKRLKDPASSLDRLLGLRSRAGGRLTLGCTLPKRDDAIRYLAASTELPNKKDQVEEILRRKNAGELAGIEALGRIPGKRRLLQIIGK